MFVVQLSDALNAPEAIKAVMARKGEYLGPILGKPSPDRAERMKKRETIRWLASLNIKT
jgi:hypothetical protein